MSLTESQMNQLERLHDEGHRVEIECGYVDSAVYSIYEDEDGRMVYDSVVFTGRPLDEVEAQQVQVFAPCLEWRPNIESMREDDRLEMFLNRPDQDCTKGHITLDDLV